MRAAPHVTVALVCALAAPASADRPAVRQAQPWLGIAIEQGEGGILVKEVLPDTPALAAGVTKGDVIVAVDGAATPSFEPFRAALARRQVGDTVALTVERSGERSELHVVLAPRPDERDMVRQRLLDRPAPAFELPVVAGKEPGKLAALSGRVVVLEFWATWCRACRAAQPALAELAKAEPDIAVLGISAEERGVLDRFAAAGAPKLTWLHDDGGAVQAAYWAGIIPTLVVIDRAGVVRYVGIGAGPDVDEAVRVAKRLEAERPRKPRRSKPGKPGGAK